MANDGIAVLDELGIESAHLVGASMGGMIVQTMAFENPSRAKSLVSIMSTTGAKHLSGMSEEMEGDFEGVEDLDVEETHKYGFYPEAMPRQLTAIFHAGDRSDQVSKIKVRTLVQHGLDDPLLPSDHGIHTAELIKGSEIKLYEGMAHNLPDEVIPLVISDMINFFQEG
jgi:pimeloyl-ACP methyl ester carboxylesterase